MLSFRAKRLPPMLSLLELAILQLGSVLASPVRSLRLCAAPMGRSRSLWGFFAVLLSFFLSSPPLFLCHIVPRDACWCWSPSDLASLSPFFSPPRCIPLAPLLLLSHLWPSNVPSPAGLPAPWPSLKPVLSSPPLLTHPKPCYPPSLASFFPPAPSRAPCSSPHSTRPVAFHIHAPFARRHLCCFPPPDAHSPSAIRFSDTSFGPRRSPSRLSNILFFFFFSLSSSPHAVFPSAFCVPLHTHLASLLHQFTWPQAPSFHLHFCCAFFDTSPPPLRASSVTTAVSISPFFSTAMEWKRGRRSPFPLFLSFFLPSSSPPFLLPFSLSSPCCRFHFPFLTPCRRLHSLPARGRRFLFFPFRRPSFTALTRSTLFFFLSPPHRLFSLGLLPPLIRSKTLPPSIPSRPPFLCSPPCVQLLRSRSAIYVHARSSICAPASPAKRSSRCELNAPPHPRAHKEHRFSTPRFCPCHPALRIVAAPHAPPLPFCRSFVWDQQRAFQRARRTASTPHWSPTIACFALLCFASHPPALSLLSLSLSFSIYLSFSLCRLSRPSRRLDFAVALSVARMRRAPTPIAPLPPTFPVVLV